MTKSSAEFVVIQNHWSLIAEIGVLIKICGVMASCQCLVEMQLVYSSVL